MNIQWHDLFTALALVLIIEGLLPFTLPDKVKAVYRSLQEAPNKSLRTMGFLSILAGLVLLYFV